MAVIIIIITLMVVSMMTEHIPIKSAMINSNTKTVGHTAGNHGNQIKNHVFVVILS